MRPTRQLITCVHTSDIKSLETTSIQITKYLVIPRRDFIDMSIQTPSYWSASLTQNSPQELDLKVSYALIKRCSFRERRKIRPLEIKSLCFILEFWNLEFQKLIFSYLHSFRWETFDLFTHPYGAIYTLWYFICAYQINCLTLHAVCTYN